MGSDKNSEFSRRVLGSRLWLVWIWICSGVVCAADIVVIIVMGVEGVQGVCFVIPAVLLVVDAFVTALSVVTNFRFKSALAMPIAYGVVKLGLIIGSSIFFAASDVVVFSNAALALWLVFEGFSIASIIISAVYAKGSGTTFLMVTAVFTVVILVLGVVYVAYISSSGFFGQNKTDTFERRTIVYSRYGDDTLMVSDVLDGNGNTVVVPDEFNGKKVVAVDCSIFTHDDVDTVVLLCDSDVRFKSMSALSNLNSAMSIYVAKDSINEYRNTFYDYARSVSSSSTNKKAYANFANCMVPIVDDGEVSVSICFEYNYLDEIGGKIPDVWVGKKGTTFTLDAYDIDYMDHMDRGSESDLYWCYENFGKVILYDMTYDGESVINQKINSSVSVYMQFDDVYAVTIGAGNDAKYSEPGLSRSNYGSDGFRYVTESGADALFDEVASRDGFTLSWQMSKSGMSSRSDITTFIGNASDKMTIYPVWTLNAPQITSLVAVSSDGSERSSFYYGNEVTLKSAATSPRSDIAIAFEWTFGGTVVSTSSSFSLAGASSGGIYPSQAGTYILTVTAGNDANTSLVSSVSRSFDLSVVKRQLNLTWTTTYGGDGSADTFVYSGKAETISVAPDNGANNGSTGLINGDTVDISLTSQTLRNKGTYTISATLSSDYYEISSSTEKKSYTIEPYTLTVVWGDVSGYTYNGTEHVPSYTLSGMTGETGMASLGDDVFAQVLSLSLTGYDDQAGEHSVTLHNSNGNYKLSGDTVTYTVAKKGVSVTWDNTCCFEYNGAVQHPDATTNDILSNDASSVYFVYVYDSSDNGTDVGTHSVRATLSSDKNYVITASNDSDKCAYTITAKAVTLSWDSTSSFVYNNTTYRIDAEILGLCSVDLGDVSLAYTDCAGETENGHTDVGTYCIYASLTGSRAFNYSLSDTGSSYTITRRPITISEKKLDLTYGARYGDDDTYQYDATSLASGESLSDVVTVAVTYYAQENCSALDAAPTACGTYTVAYALTAGTKYANYSVTGPSGCGQIVMTQKEIAATWTVGSYTYDGSGKTPTVSINASLLEYSDTANLTLTYYSGASAEGTGSNSVPVDAGSYFVVVTMANKNYTISNAGQSYTINKAVLTISWTNTAAVTYNGEAHTPIATVSGAKTDDDASNISLSYSYADANGTSYSGTNSSPKDAGTYTVTLTVTYPESNYSLSGSTSVTFTINKKMLTISWSDETTFTYDGEVHTPMATVSGAMTGCDENCISLSYSYAGANGTSYGETSDSPKDAGTYTVTLTVTYPESNYSLSGSTSVTFTINKKTLTINWSDEATFTYDGSSKSPSATVNGALAEDTISFSYSYTYTGVDGTTYSSSSAPTDVGKYTVTVTVTYSDNNYFLDTSNATCSFEIVGAG